MRFCRPTGAPHGPHARTSSPFSLAPELVRHNCCRREQSRGAGPRSHADLVWPACTYTPPPPSVSEETRFGGSAEDRSRLRTSDNCAYRWWAQGPQVSPGEGSAAAAARRPPVALYAPRPPGTEKRPACTWSGAQPAAMPIRRPGPALVSEAERARVASLRRTPA